MRDSGAWSMGVGLQGLQDPEHLRGQFQTQPVPPWHLAIVPWPNLRTRTPLVRVRDPELSKKTRGPIVPACLPLQTK